nr:MAG TPA: endonuclease [Caudoviricetes sp.]
MLLSLQVRLYPTKQMKSYLDSQCDYRRYCWNKALSVWNDLYDQRVIALPRELKLKIKDNLTDKTIRFTEEELNLRKRFPSPTERIVRDELVANKSDWEYEKSSRVLQLAVKDLSIAWNQFFKKSQENSDKPKFKSRREPKQGFKTDTARIKYGRLLLDKPRAYTGQWESIRFKGYNIPEGPIKLCAITRVKNQYIATLTVEVKTISLKSTGNVTAVDANVDHFDYTDGTYTLKPKELNRLYGKVKHYQRLLSRKRKECGIHSKSYQKTRTKLQMTYSKIKHIQNDLLHKFTTKLYRNYDIIVIEDLSVKKMQMSKKAKGLHRSLFGRFRLFMEYKALKFEKRLVIADKYYPSTQRCSCCGYVKTGEDKITLTGNLKHGTKHHEYHCYECGYKADRDENAVLNLLVLI